MPTSPGVAALPYEGEAAIAREVSRTGEKVEALGQYGAQVYNYLQRAQDNVEALKIKNNLAADFDEEAQKYLLRSDYKNFQDDANQFTENTRKKYGEIIAKNPRLQKPFETYFGIQARRFKHIVTLKEAHETQREGQTQFLMDLDRGAQEIAGEPDPSRKEFISNEIKQEAEFLIGSHILDRVWAYEKLKGLDAKAEETEIVNGVKSLDVATIEGTLDKMNQPGAFPNVDPVKKANFQAYGEGRVENLSKKYQAEIDKRNIDKGFKDLKEKFTVGEDTNYTAMRKELRSPTFQKEYTLSQIEAIERGINAEESGFQKERKLAHDKEESEIQNAISLGKATQGMIRNAKYLTADEKQKWETVNEKRMKKSDDDISNNEDAKEYIRINDLISLGADPRVIKDAIAGSTHLKTGTRQKLLDRVDKDLETHIKEGMKKGNDYLHKQIAPSKGAMMPSIPEEEARSAKAQQALHDWASTQNKLAVAGKRPPLTEKEIFDKAEEMAPYYRMGLFEKMETMQKDMEEQARKARAKTAPSTKPSNERLQLEQKAQEFLQDNGQLATQANIEHAINQGWVK